MEIKLNELFDLITEDDDFYLGLPLKDKIKEVLKHLPSLKGQTVEGHLKLPLLNCLLT